MLELWEELPRGGGQRKELLPRGSGFRDERQGEESVQVKRTECWRNMGQCQWCTYLLHRKKPVEILSNCCVKVQCPESFGDVVCCFVSTCSSF